MKCYFYFFTSLHIYSQEILYDEKFKRGFLFDKFKNKEAVEQMKLKKMKATTKNAKSNSNTKFSPQEEVELLNSLKRMVISQKDLLKTKLLETVDQRRVLIQKDINKYLEKCNFYFVLPQMVK